MSYAIAIFPRGITKKRKTIRFLIFINGMRQRRIRAKAQPIRTLKVVIMKMAKVMMVMPILKTSRAAMAQKTINRKNPAPSPKFPPACPRTAIQPFRAT